MKLQQKQNAIQFREKLQTNTNSFFRILSFCLVRLLRTHTPGQQEHLDVSDFRL